MHEELILFHPFINTSAIIEPFSPKVILCSFTLYFYNGGFSFLSEGLCFILAYYVGLIVSELGCREFV